MSAKAKVLNAFYAIADSSHHYQDKWISDQGLVEILTTHSPTNVKDIEKLTHGSGEESQQLSREV